MSIKKIPCGGFYVNDDAVEMIDGKPVLKTSGSDEVLENAKSTGGIGWTESGEQVLYDGDLLINTPISDSGTVYNIIDIDQLEVGETYKVVWNGVEYTCECVGGEVTYIGNASIIGAPFETDEPFVFTEEEGVVLVATNTSGTYSIKLSKNGETIHKIDEKYLPASGGAVIIEINSDTGEPSIPKTEIDSLVSSGVMVYATIENATIPMVCDGVYGKMEFFGFVGASFNDDGKLNYADVYDACWEESTNNFIVNSGWSEFGA